jgi:site-specific recombinase XerD
MDALEKIMSSYKSHGGKGNRAEQVDKIRKMMSHFGFIHPNQITNKHVISFYKYLKKQNKAEKTIYNYYLAIEKLYKFLGKQPPPKPF